VSVAVSSERTLPSKPAVLAASYAHCSRLARKAASNFYLAFWLLPRTKRRAMCALYAFLRRADDIGDSAAPIDERRAELNAWRSMLDRAFAGHFADPLLPALVDTVERHAIPREYLYDALDGVAMDLDDRAYETQAELEQYCYRVASVVGLACIHIWGFRSAAALEPARRCGLAFQWTNILRDLGEDAARGRVYLPLEALRRQGFDAQELIAGVADTRFDAVFAEQIAITRGQYRAAAELPDFLTADGRRVFAAMYATYRDLLDRVERAGRDVLVRRVRVPTWRKMQLAAQALVNRKSNFAKSEPAAT
jgi:phytoene synthase